MKNLKKTIDAYVKAGEDLKKKLVDEIVKEVQRKGIRDKEGEITLSVECPATLNDYIDVPSLLVETDRHCCCMEHLEKISLSKGKKKTGDPRFYCETGSDTTNDWIMSIEEVRLVYEFLMIAKDDKEIEIVDGVIREKETV